MEALDDLPGSLKFLVGVRPGEIEVELVGVDLGQEVAAVLEGFQIEELVFFEAVDGFDVALEGVSGRRNTDICLAILNNVVIEPLGPKHDRATFHAVLAEGHSGRTVWVVSDACVTQENQRKSPFGRNTYQLPAR
jgi:hypothetical protein